MKKFLFDYPVLSTAIIFCIFFLIPVVFGIFFSYQSIAGYISPIVLLLLTYFLYRAEGKDLSALGLELKLRRAAYLFIGLMLGILFFIAFTVIQSWYNRFSLRFNASADYVFIFTGFAFLLQGVLNEELIFRGYCFKKTVDRAGIINANLLFAFLFIVWHWIALNAWGNYAAMLSLITTGFGHFLFATALMRSGTLFLPIGIHLGNNWAQFYLFGAHMGRIDSKAAQASLITLDAPVQEFSQLHVIGSYCISISFFLLSTWVVWKFMGTRIAYRSRTSNL